MDRTSLIILQIKLKKSEKLFSLWQFKVTSFITFYASGYPSAREFYSAVKKNASMTSNLHIIQIVFHIMFCGKVL